MYKVKARKPALCFIDICRLVRTLTPIVDNMNKFIAKLPTLTLEELQSLK
jgi:hypothetical protein